MLTPYNMLLNAHHRVLRAPSAVSSSDRAVLNEFTSAWVINKKIQFAGIRPESRDNGDRGMFATYPLSQGVKLASVPASVPITVAASSEPPPSQIPPDVWQQLPWYCQMAVKLMARLQEPGYASYKAVLPSSVNLPALWEDDWVQQLQCPYIIGKIKAEQAQWAQVASLLQPYIPASQLYWALAVVRSRSFAGPHFSVPMFLKAGLAVALPTAALLAGIATGQGVGAGSVAAAVGSLAIPAALAAWDLQQAQTKVKYTIAPYLDMFNHSSSSSSEVGFDWVKEAYTVSASQSYSPGQQVYITYGELSNDALLQLYGFVEEGNPHDRYVMADMAQWLLEGPLLAAASGDRQMLLGMLAAAPPGLFTEVVVTRAGLPADVQQAVQALATKLAPAFGKSTPALAKEAQAHAVMSELQALGTSLEADTQELQQKQRLVWLAQQAEPQPPVEPKAPVQPSAPHQTPALSPADTALQAGVILGTDEIGVATATTASTTIGMQKEYQQTLQQHEEELQQYSQQLEQYNAGMQQYNQQLEHYRQLHTDWQQAVTLGSPAGSRHCIVLQYRIEKKRLLQACLERLA